MVITEEKKDIEINPIEMKTDYTDKHRKRILETMGFKPPFLLYIVGGSGSGKTTLLLNLLLNKKPKILRDCFHTINIWSPSLGTLPDELGLPEDNIHENFDRTEVADILKNLDPEEENLFIIDDCISDVNKTPPKNAVGRMFFNYRHYNLSIILTSQYYNMLDKKYRCNFKNIIMFECNKPQLDDFFKDHVLVDKERFDEIIDYIFKGAPKGTYLKMCGKNFYKNFNKLKFDD